MKLFLILGSVNVFIKCHCIRLLHYSVSCVQVEHFGRWQHWMKSISIIIKVGDDKYWFHISGNLANRCRNICSARKCWMNRPVHIFWPLGIKHTLFKIFKIPLIMASDSGYFWCKEWCRVQALPSVISTQCSWICFRRVEKWGGENFFLDMPDVSSGASHIAPGKTTKRYWEEVHWIIMLFPLPRHAYVFFSSVIVIVELSLFHHIHDW